MSVRVGERTEGKLQVLECSRKLAIYTVQIVKNEKHFPKSQRWVMTQRIVNEALDTMTCIRKANSVYFRGSDNIQDYEYRRRMQVEAHAHLCALLSLIDISFEAFGNDGVSVEHWVQLAVDTDEKLKAWMKSDKERLKQS